MPETAAPLDARVKVWSLAVVVGACLWNVHLLHRFLAQAQSLSGRFGSLVRFSLGASLLLTVALLLGASVGWRRLADRYWEVLIAGLFALVVLAPAFGKTAGRLLLGPERMTLDPILQVEVASEMLAQGRNPYAETYFGTDLGRWNGGADLPAMHHLVYPPLPVVVTLPLRKLCLRTVGVYDSRFLLIPVLIVSFCLTWRAWKGWPWRGVFLGLAFLNPLLIEDFHVGRWDTLILLLWILALRSAAAGQGRAMAVWLALGALTKTTLLASALMGVIYVCRSRREALRWLGLFAAVFLGLFLPFFLWNPREMYLDLFGATQGIGPHPFPITSTPPFGFASVVLALGWAASPAAYFPFWIFQIPATLGTAVCRVRSLLKDRTLEGMAIGFVSIVGVYLYFNRYSDPSWFGALASMALLASGTDRSRRPSA